jgi:glycosyltransferase involved in cell wall biosynthesis
MELTFNHPPSMRTRKKVSILLTTYNHEKWIAEAIESVVMQQTTFDYEVVIIEDCSTDNTRNIVIDYQQRNPEKIRLLLSEENKNDNTNFVTAWQTSPSQYVATLDGDDYWTSAHKLQKQVDYLDARPELAICFHNVTAFREEGKKVLWNYNPPEQKDLLSLEDLWTYNFIAGCSPMLRRGLIKEFPEWYATALWGDWPLYILAAQHGKIGYIDEVMGVYRLHEGGYWSKLSKTQQLEALLKFYEDMLANLELKYKDIVQIHTMMSGYYRILLQIYYERLHNNNQQIGSLKDSLSHSHEEARRLKKRTRRLKLEVQNLERQLQGVRESRTYRLLRGIDRLRSNVFGT